MDCSPSKYFRIQDFDTITFFSVQFRENVDEHWSIDILAFVYAILHINKELYCSLQLSVQDSTNIYLGKSGSKT